MLEFNGPKCYGKQIYGVTAYGEWKPLKGKSLEIWRQHQIGRLAPYGKWTCRAGREILFNRNYGPIYQRYSGSQPTRADHREHVFWVDQIWFYDSSITPQARRLIITKTKLVEWGVLEDFNESVAQLSDADLQNVYNPGNSFRWK